MSSRKKSHPAMIAMAASLLLAVPVSAQVQVDVVASSNETIETEGPSGSPWFHTAQVPGGFQAYGISSFTLTAEDFGVESVASIEEVAISYTQSNAFFTTDGPVAFQITFDSTISAGDYSTLTHNGSGTGVDDSQFSDDPSTTDLGTATFTQVESGTVDTYVLDVTGVADDLLAAINSGSPFSIIIGAPSGETAATHAGIENNTYPDSIVLSVTAGEGSSGEPTGDPALIITGVLDGPLPGGLPKVIELYALADVADLSVYGVGSANNGGGTDGEELTLSGSVSAGDYIWIASEDLEFTNVFGMAPHFVSDAAGINGDDAIELFMNGEVVDVFGQIDVDGTGQAWEYLDSWVYRKKNTSADGSFDINDWIFGGVNALDDLDAAGVAATVPFGTFGASNFDPANLLPNANFNIGGNGKSGWITWLNVFDTSGANYLYGTGWDTGTAIVDNGGVILYAHPGWTDNGNGPADLGQVIENNFYHDFGGSPGFAGQTVTFSGSLTGAEEPDPGTEGFAFVKILDGGWGVSEFQVANVDEVDGSFSLTTTVPTENMNAFQVGLAVKGVAGSAGAIRASGLSLKIAQPGDGGLPWTYASAGQHLVSPWFGSFTMSEDGWIQHRELNWLYIGYVTDEASMWIYSLFRDAWLWSSRDLFPIVYDSSTGGYVYFVFIPDVGVYVYDYNTSTWALNP